MLTTKKKCLSDFIYSQEVDRKRCLRDLMGRDMKQFRKRLDHYLDMLLMVPFFHEGRDVDEKSVSLISSEQRLRKYLEEHPRKSEYTERAIQSHRLVDKNGEEFKMWHEFWARDAPKGNRNIWGRCCRFQR